MIEWIKQGRYPRENLGLYWPADFNAKGVIKKGRVSLKIEDAPKQNWPDQFYTHTSMGRPMVTMRKAGIHLYRSLFSALSLELSLRFSFRLSLALQFSFLLSLGLHLLLPP